MSDVAAVTTITIVHHSPTPLLREILHEVVAGVDLARGELGEDSVELRVVEALEATADDVLAADAVILGTTANFGYIFGALKHFFDCTFSELQAKTKGKPFSFYIRGGHDTTGAEKAITAITTGLEWNLAAPSVAFVGELSDQVRGQLTEMSASLTALAAQKS